MADAKAAVFDLGNVLLRWQPESYYAQKFGAAHAQKFFDEVPIDQMNDRSDLGENLSDLVVEYSKRHPEWSDEISLWWTNWIDICAPAIEGSVQILRALKATEVPVFSLTNFGEETLSLAKETYAFLNEFDAEFVSGTLNVMKPDPGIYDALERGTGLSGSELVFADDRADNIAAAQARGWQTHLFEGPDGWKSKLIETGLLS